MAWLWATPHTQLKNGQDGRGSPFQSRSSSALTLWRVTRQSTGASCPRPPALGSLQTNTWPYPRDTGATRQVLAASLHCMRAGEQARQSA